MLCFQLTDGLLRRDSRRRRHAGAQPLPDQAGPRRHPDCTHRGPLSSSSQHQRQRHRDEASRPGAQQRHSGGKNKDKIVFPLSY